MAKVYAHRRLNDDVIFYIGISVGEKRPYSSRGRNYDWKKEVKIHGGFKVEILYDNISLEQAKNLEIKLISEYGRRNLGLGTLVNWTDGGEGVSGFKRARESNEKQSESMKKISNIYKTEKFKKTMSDITSKEKNGMYGKNHTNESIEKMKNTWTQEKKDLYKEMNSGNKNPMYGKKNANRSEANKLQIGGNNPRARKILQYDLNGNLIQEFSCIKEAEEKTGVSKIGEKCKGYRKQTGKYIFKYKNKN